MSLIIGTFWKLDVKAVPRDGRVWKQADEADNLKKVHQCLRAGLYISHFSSHLGPDIRLGLGDKLLRGSGLREPAC